VSRNTATGERKPFRCGRQSGRPRRRLVTGDCNSKKKFGSHDANLNARRMIRLLMLAGHTAQRGSEASLGTALSPLEEVFPGRVYPHGRAPYEDRGRPALTRRRGPLSL
jgi:hypothetical protein